MSVQRRARAPSLHKYKLITFSPKSCPSEREIKSRIGYLIFLYEFLSRDFGKRLLLRRRLLPWGLPQLLLLLPLLWLLVAIIGICVGEVGEVAELR